MLELNPVDAERAESIKARLQRTGRAQIENVLTSASAERLLERATAAQYNVVTRKSDGHIDADEQRAIDLSLSQLQVGEEAQGWVQEALDQPLNPALIARSVQNEDEALEVYYLSCLVIDVDHFMERGYLDALAQALKIPADVKQGIESDVNEKKRELA